jgi:two-component system nitrogen regulation sensor histidine kinase NtrY
MLRTKDGQDKQITDLQQETISDIAFSLDTIHRRTDGLLNFIEHYRQLTKVPKPVIENIHLDNYFKNIIRLMTKTLTQNNIEIDVKLQEKNELVADPMLLEQVLINLITNSVHALKETVAPRIQILVYPKDNQIIIEIKDNGKGIPKKELSEIFIPFFTTKKEGSGIGLSLSKQIMSLHGGSIRVQSTENVGTSFYLSFNQQH